MNLLSPMLNGFLWELSICHISWRSLKWRIISHGCNELFGGGVDIKRIALSSRGFVIFLRRILVKPLEDLKASIRKCYPFSRIY